MGIFLRHDCRVVIGCGWRNAMSMIKSEMNEMFLLYARRYAILMRRMSCSCVASPQCRRREDEALDRVNIARQHWPESRPPDWQQNLEDSRVQSQILPEIISRQDMNHVRRGTEAHVLMCSRSPINQPRPPSDPSRPLCIIVVSIVTTCQSSRVFRLLRAAISRAIATASSC